MTSRRITIVASELLGRAGTGGAGTADSLLAVALGRHGHDVDLLVASGRDIGSLGDEWTRIYDSAGVKVRVLERRPGVRPPYLAPTLEVFGALRESPPDVAIVNDWRGLGWAAMRARQLDLALTKTVFVVHCHGPGRVLAEFAQKVPDTFARFGEQVTERASLELADAVVSPSAWLLEWMRAHDWPVPESARVVQYIRQSTALEEEPERMAAAGPVTRLAFFGQLREGKGVRIFLDALDALEPSLLAQVEVVFLGSESKRWTHARIAERLAGRTANVGIETGLTREAALQVLLQPGTLAVMPSLLDNSPNTVAECIERGIPFVSTHTGGIPELVAPDDRERVLCEPNALGLKAALQHVLESSSGSEPARPAEDPGKSLEAWLELVAAVVPATSGGARRAGRVAIVAGGAESARRARRLAEITSSLEVEVVAGVSRRDGLARTASDWVVFLDDEDEPDDSFLETLVAAQAASGADLVTSAVRPRDEPEGIQVFLGDPGSLGLVENQYGVVGLLRSELAAAERLPDGAVDPDWPLFARIALKGGRVLSFPEPLATHAGRPGQVDDVPGEGLAVLDAFEEAHVRDLRDLPQLAATLAASARRRAATATVDVDGVAPPVGRLRSRLRLGRFAPWARSSSG
jgi:glycosyltransferase involved in cell wall biosynthesis